MLVTVNYLACRRMSTWHILRGARSSVKPERFTFFLVTKRPGTTARLVHSPRQSVSCPNENSKTYTDKRKGTKPPAPRRRWRERERRLATRCPSDLGVRLLYNSLSFAFFFANHRLSLFVWAMTTKGSTQRRASFSLSIHVARVDTPGRCLPQVSPGEHHDSQRSWLTFCEASVNIHTKSATPAK